MDVKARPLAKDSKILIFGGGGTMGSSTALHLARRGYTDITILDPFEIPSAQAAGASCSERRAARPTPDERLADQRLPP